jgi:hypothetical protein
MTRDGFPHSEIFGSKRACRSPKLIAAYHVLHRLLMPRHPLCALSSLTKNLGLHLWRIAIPDTHLYAIVKDQPRSRGRNSLFEDGHSNAPMSILEDRILNPPAREVVGVPGIEPGTSSLSGTRSNQLSYTPYFAHRLRLARRRASPRAGWLAMRSSRPLPRSQSEAWWRQPGSNR